MSVDAIRGHAFVPTGKWERCACGLWRRTTTSGVSFSWDGVFWWVTGRKRTPKCKEAAS